ncbi:MAG: cytochrome P450 [Anaerolineae bacterium]|nr:cytochrome P450 [Anaerolineae bacterium]
MNTKTIPTAQGAPIVGLTSDMIANAPEFLLSMADEYGEIVQFKMFGKRFVLVSAPDLIRDVLVTQYENFPKSDRDAQIIGRFLGKGLVANNDIPFHKTQRKLMQPAFHVRRINAYADVMADYTRRVMTDWQDSAVYDMAEAMMSLTMFIVSKTLYNADMETMAEQAHVIGNAIAVMQTASNDDYQGLVLWPEWLPTSRNRRRRAARDVLYDVIDRLIAERRASGTIEDTGDLLSMLLLAEYDDGTHMPDQQVRDELVTLFAAGHETTSNALTWTWYLLSQNRDVEAQLHAELDTVLGGRSPKLEDLPALPFTLQTIKEALRLYPPAWLLNGRYAIADTAVGDYIIPKGSTIFIAPYAQHRLPRYWDNPEQFDPTRFAPEREKALSRYVYMPFGGGPRICIGNSFALMEAHLIVATIAQRLRFELVPEQMIELNPQITLSNKTGMHMRVVERVVSAETTQRDVSSIPST